MATKDKSWAIRDALSREQRDLRGTPRNGTMNGISERQNGAHDSTSAPEARPKRSIVPYKRPGYDIKRQYGATVQLGLILSLALIVGFFRAPLQSEDDFEITLVEQENVQMEEIRQTKQEMRPPPPPRPPVPIEVPDDRIIEDVEINLDAELNISEQLFAVPPPPPSAALEEEVEEEEEEIFVVVEQMPEIIGGTPAIYQYLSYPEMARKAGMEGLVVVQVVVETDGSPTDPQVVRSPGAVLDQAAVDAVMNLRFKPGMQRGKPVRVRYALPVRFRLRD